MALLRSNATVSSKRGAVVVNSHVRVMIAAARPENLSPEGVQISTTILANPGTDWRTGDQVTIEALDGFTDLDQTTKRDVLSAQRQAGLLPTIKIFLRGTIQ